MDVKWWMHATVLKFSANPMILLELWLNCCFSFVCEETLEKCLHLTDILYFWSDCKSGHWHFIKEIGHSSHNLTVCLTHWFVETHFEASISAFWLLICVSLEPDGTSKVWIWQEKPRDTAHVIVYLFIHNLSGLQCVTTKSCISCMNAV